LSCGQEINLAILERRDDVMSLGERLWSISVRKKGVWILWSWKMREGLQTWKKERGVL
jgi:hypothetical protein